MRKKGSAHLEMILAFTIFTVVVVFLLVYIKPTETNKLSEVAVISLKDSFVDAASTNLVIVFVNGTEERCSPEGISSMNWTYKNISDSYYYVYFSDEFDSRGSECTPDTVTTGSISTKSVLSDHLLTAMQEEYYSDYGALRERLSIPSSLDFDIESPEYSLMQGEVGEVDIIAKEYILPVLNSEGESINIKFRFRVW